MRGKEVCSAHAGFGDIGLPLLAFLLTLCVLSAARQGRENYGLPMLVPLSLLAARASLPAAFLKWARAGIFILVALLAGVIWYGWVAQWVGHPAFVLAKLQAKAPGYVPAFNGWEFGMALAATLGWLVFTRREFKGALRSLRTAKARPTLESGMVFAHWAVGVALLYLLAMTLWLPVTNANMTYRKDFAGLREVLGKKPGIIGSRNLGEPQRAMLHYWAGVTTWQEETRDTNSTNSTNYQWLLIQGEDKAGERPQAPDASWEQVWEGRHHREIFRLFHQKK